MSCGRGMKRSELSVSNRCEHCSKCTCKSIEAVHVQNGENPVKTVIELLLVVSIVVGGAWVLIGDLCGRQPHIELANVVGLLGLSVAALVSVVAYRSKNEKWSYWGLNLVVAFSFICALAAVTKFRHDYYPSWSGKVCKSAHVQMCTVDKACN